MTNTTCPVYAIRRISKADQIRFRDKWYKTAETRYPYPVKWEVVDIYFGFPYHGDRGRTVTSFPHSVYVAYEKETGLPIGRIAVDGKPWINALENVRIHYKYAYIDGITISRDFQGCGIGTNLMRAVENDYRSHKIHKGIYLHCYKRDVTSRSGEIYDRNTVAFYQKLGYEVCDRADRNLFVGRYHSYNQGINYFENRGVAVMYKLF